MRCLDLLEPYYDDDDDDDDNGGDTRQDKIYFGYTGHIVQKIQALIFDSPPLE